jgi:hypothetical protein
MVGEGKREGWMGEEREGERGREDNKRQEGRDIEQNKKGRKEQYQIGGTKKKEGMGRKQGRDITDFISLNRETKEFLLSSFISI